MDIGHYHYYEQKKNLVISRTEFISITYFMKFVKKLFLNNYQVFQMKHAYSVNH